MYETSLPRIMFVVKRAIKVLNGIQSQPSDNELHGISGDITWYSKYIGKGHPIFPIFGHLQSFYKIARNVGNHHKGFTLEPNTNLITLSDTKDKAKISATLFLQKHRHLTHFCDLGLRGILSAFCKNEQGGISNRLVNEYAKIFPPDWTGGEKGIVDLYDHNR